MKVYTYSEARQKLAELLNQALQEEVLIRRRDGATFSVISKRNKRSPFDVKGIKTTVSTRDMLDAIKESRES
jgi:hypothetical protein